MATFSRAAILVMEEGHFWNEPKEEERWVAAFNPRTGNASDFIKFAVNKGFPGP